MNRYRTMLSLVAVSSTLVWSSGCIIVSGGWGSPAVWTETVQDTLPLPAEGRSKLAVQTHNGSIGVHGMGADGSASTVSITKKTGGLTAHSAQAAMDALRVYAIPSGLNTVKVGWDWHGSKRRDWRAKVSFDIAAPSEMGLVATTHNGPVVVDGLEGKVKIRTHNGRIDVKSNGDSLHAQTHNGRISATFDGQSVKLVTHNGRVRADLAGSRAVEGEIRTHNGRVEIELSQEASLRLTGSTHNGRMRCDLDLTNAKVSRHLLSGTIGQGDGRLSVTTHNGGILIKKKGEPTKQADATTAAD